MFLLYFLILNINISTAYNLYYTLNIKIFKQIKKQLKLSIYFSSRKYLYIKFNILKKCGVNESQSAFLIFYYILFKFFIHIYYLLLSNGIPSAFGALDFLEVNTSAIIVATYGSIL